MTSDRESPTVPETLLTVKDVAGRLHVHEQTVRTWMREGDIGNVTIGRYRYVSATQLDKFIAKHTNDV